MTHLVKQWIARAISLCIIGPLCAAIAWGVVAPDGSHETTLLSGRSLGSGATSLVMILGLIFGMGVVFGRLIDRREGILNIAFVLGWVAWTSGRLGEVYRVSPDSGTLITLAVEALVIMVVVLFSLVLMTNPNKGWFHGHSDDISRFDLGYLVGSLTSKAGVVSLIGALIAGLVTAMLFGQTDLPGQSVGVGFGAGIFGGVLGAMAGASTHSGDGKYEPTAFAPIMIGVMLCGVIGPLIGLIKPGGGELLGLMLIGDLPGYLVLSPAAWVMGALLGVPVGHSWVEHSAAHATGVAAKAG